MRCCSCYVSSSLGFGHVDQEDRNQRGEIVKSVGEVTVEGMPVLAA